MPFVGDLSNSCIVLLLLNPGLSATDYFAEMNVPGFRDRLLANLRQDFRAQEYPFFPLDPQLAWHSGNRYWERKLGGVVAELAKAWKQENNEVRRHIAKRISAVELLPYHSGSFGLSRKARDTMTSMNLAKDYVKNILKPRADAGNCLIVAMRSVESWGLQADEEHIIRFTGGQARGAYLRVREASSAGSRVVEMLLRDRVANPHD